MITVVVPVYNRAAIVCRTLDSIRAQDYRPLKLILVDNHSTDGTPDVLNSWAVENSVGNFEVKVLLEPTPGASAARNAGLREVSTEWIMFFDSDDLMLPGHITRAMNAACDSGADIIGWDAEEILENGKTVIRRFAGNNYVYNNVFHSIFGTWKYMATTRLFRKAGGWLEGAGMLEDAELGMRLLLQNPRIFYVKGRPTVRIMRTPGSLSHFDSTSFDGMRKSIEAIRRSLPEGKKHWADLEAIILCTAWASGNSRARRYADAIIARTPWPHRCLWKLLRAYTKRGGRGAARLYYPFRMI